MSRVSFEVNLTLPQIGDSAAVFEVLRRSLHTARLYWRGATVHGVERDFGLVQSAMFLGGHPTFDVTIANTSLYDPCQIDPNLEHQCPVPGASYHRKSQPLARSPSLHEQMWISELARRIGAKITDTFTEPPLPPGTRFKMVHLGREMPLWKIRWVEPHNASWRLQIDSPDPIFGDEYDAPLDYLLSLGSLQRIREMDAIRMGGQWQQQRIHKARADWLAEAESSLVSMLAEVAARVVRTG